MLEYLAQCEAAYREAVVHPAAERHARHDRALNDLRRGRDRPRWYAPARWMGARLLRAGTRSPGKPAASATRTV